MAGKKENIKALFTNTRSRVIIVFTLILLVIAIVLGAARLIHSNDRSSASSDVPNTPGIQSIPGAIDPTVQYAKLQEAQNVTQAKSALKTGGSAIPTIVRSQALGAGVQSIGAQNGQGGLGFSALTRENEEGVQRSEWVQELKNSSCSKETANKVMNEGATLTELKGACSCIQLKDDGYQVAELQQVCSCKELKSAGFNARQLKDIGFSAGRLRLCGFDACELRNAGFSAQQMKDGGFTDGELKGAGFSDEEIARAGGLPRGVTEADVRNAGCQVDALTRLRASGVSASAIRRISGCSIAQLKAAGFTAQNLKDAGFTAADLKNAGFTADQLKAAGFSARDLLNAGFTPDELASAGFTPAEIVAAESELPPGITPDDVKKAGCEVNALKNERLAGVSAKLIKQYAGCSAQALKEAGFTDDDLAKAGFTPQQIGSLSSNDAAIRAAGCDPDKLKTLLAEHVSALRIHELNGCNASQLKAAGYDAKSLLDAGFTPQDLSAAGFTPEQTNAAQIASDTAIKEAGCDPTKLKALYDAGVSAKRIHALNNCSASQLKAAGYDAKDLLAAGFSPADLTAAGFTPEQIRAALSTTNPSIATVVGRKANCSVAFLTAARVAGVSANTIRQTQGCDAAAMKAAGYSAAELKAAGFTAAELKNAGFTPAQLKEAGFSAKELHDAGFSAQELKNAGFTVAELKDAGFTATELKGIGFTAAELKKAGFTADELKDAGFTAGQLKAAGFTAKELKNAGFSAADELAAGFLPADLKNAGYSDSDNSDVASLALKKQAVGADSGVTAIPNYQFNQPNKNAAAEIANAQKLQKILENQNQQLADQRYQQKIQQRNSEMSSAANQSIQGWKKVSIQTYTEGAKETKGIAENSGNNGQRIISDTTQDNTMMNVGSAPKQKALIKTGDILFAVIDTAINSDEPGPILATIVSGKYRNAKLIGSFTLPANAEKMVITFNTLSVPGANKTTSISAYAIDANTARTALSSNTDHHYLLRYGSLFASSFLEGFGNAFQSANTTVTVGGVAGAGTVTVQNGIGRSALENAVIGLATVGKDWGQVAQQQFNTPTTVQVYSGTGIGILFTQDLFSL